MNRKFLAGLLGVCFVATIALPSFAKAFPSNNVGRDIVQSAIMDGGNNGSKCGISVGSPYGYTYVNVGWMQKCGPDSSTCTWYNCKGSALYCHNGRCHLK